MEVIDHFSRLDDATQKAVKRAEQKVIWYGTHARVLCGDNVANAYPVTRSGGRIVWNVVSRDTNLAIAYGVF